MATTLPGVLNLPARAGVGTRMATVSATGDVGDAPIPAGGGTVSSPGMVAGRTPVADGAQDITSTDENLLTFQASVLAGATANLLPPVNIADGETHAVELLVAGSDVGTKSGTSFRAFCQVTRVGALVLVSAFVQDQLTLPLADPMSGCTLSVATPAGQWQLQVTNASGNSTDWTSRAQYVVSL